MEDKYLFQVEFGDPNDSPTTISFNGPRIRPLFVVAKDYNTAVIKANMYLETKLEELKEHDNKVLTGDGSLNPFGQSNKKIELVITAIRLINEIIW